MITDILCETISSGTFTISWRYNGTFNKVITGSYTTRDDIVGRLIDAQTKPAEKIIREIKYIGKRR